MLPNIALYGRTGAGKSTIADQLANRHGYARAHPGGVCREITRRLFNTEEKARLNEVNDLIRSLDPDVWVRVSLEEVEGDKPIVIDGIRFLSNLEFLKGRGFQLWKVDAPKEARKVRLEARAQQFDWSKDVEHTGETELENLEFDLTIVNSGDLESLSAAVEAELIALTR